MIYLGNLHVFFVFNHKQNFLSDWEIDCKWIAMKLHERQNVFIGGGGGGGGYICIYNIVIYYD